MATTLLNAHEGDKLRASHQTSGGANVKSGFIDPIPIGQIFRGRFGNSARTGIRIGNWINKTGFDISSA